MFLHVSVCPQGGGIPTCLAGLQGGVSQHALQVSMSTPRGELEGSGWGGLQVHTQGEGLGVWPGGSPGPHLGGVSQHALRQPHLPQLMTTAAGGTHPTGMHSCILFCFVARLSFPFIHCRIYKGRWGGGGGRSKRAEYFLSLLTRNDEQSNNLPPKGRDLPLPTPAGYLHLVAATAVVGMHSTRTHSCYLVAFIKHILMAYYCPQTKLWKGNVFTPVCQSFCLQGGVCLSACWDIHLPHPLGRHPPGQTSPPGRPLPSACWDTHPLPSACWDTPPCPVHAGIDMATAADGTHPTGMHSCSH